ncbi:MAG: chemotaxis protein [Pseudomonadota bacterium]
MGSYEAIDGGILLESGTNEFEVLVFKIGDQTFGVNVAKIREIIVPTKVVPCPGQPESVLGMISLRGKAVPLVSMHLFCAIPSNAVDPSRQCIIVTDFSGVHCAFLADCVEEILRAGWKQIQPVPDIGSGFSSMATGILNIDQRLIPMIDFESIYAELFKNRSSYREVDESEYHIDRGKHTVYMAEDSVSINALIESTLRDSGYTDLHSFSNGQACWQHISDNMNGGKLPHIVITDIEMPLMDGLALTRNIKNNEQTQHIPVILFSSLVSEDNRNKGEQVGANEQLPKPRMADVVIYADKWISRTYYENDSPNSEEST